MHCTPPQALHTTICSPLNGIGKAICITRQPLWLACISQGETQPLFAGSFFGAAFENGCKTVQGASGGVFGMMGLFIADLILNFETVKRQVPLQRFSKPSPNAARKCISSLASLAQIQAFIHSLFVTQSEAEKGMFATFYL